MLLLLRICGLSLLGCKSGDVALGESSSLSILSDPLKTLSFLLRLISSLLRNLKCDLNLRHIVSSSETYRIWLLITLSRLILLPGFGNSSSDFGCNITLGISCNEICFNKHNHIRPNIYRKCFVCSIDARFRSRQSSSVGFDFENWHWRTVTRAIHAYQELFYSYLKFAVCSTSCLAAGF